MKYNHDEIREKLPEYLNDTLERDVRRDIEAHLGECSECREEYTLISGLKKVEAPDPGDLFFKTLPQKVSRIVIEDKKKVSIFGLLLRPARVFVPALLVLIIIFTFVYIKDKRTTEIDFLFEDPLAYPSIEINGITEEDVSAIIGGAIKGDIDEIYYEEFSPYSYHMELASLSSKEMESLSEALDRQQTKGG